MKIIVFDFDDTLCDGQSINGFIKLLLKKSSLIYTFKYYWRKLLMPYKNNEYPYYKEYLLKTFLNLTEDFFETSAKEYARILIDTRLHSTILSELKAHQIERSKVILSSGGFEIYLKYIAEELKFDYLFATKLAFENHLFTGKILGNENLDEEKVINLKNVYPNIDIMEIYTDSKNDMPLILIANKVNIIVNNNSHTQWINSDWRKITV